MRKVLGLEPLKDEGTTTLTSTKIEALFDNKDKPMTLSERLAKIHESSKSMFHSGISDTISFIGEKPN